MAWHRKAGGSAPLMRLQLTKGPFQEGNIRLRLPSGPKCRFLGGDHLPGI